jgi:hypothetical protein
MLVELTVITDVRSVTTIEEDFFLEVFGQVLYTNNLFHYNKYLNPL